jgi:hypothetical protein
MISSFALVRQLFCLSLLLTGISCGSVAYAQAPCPNPIPNPPVASISSPLVPNDACVPAGVPGVPIQFFDDYSWRAFIAVIWPAAIGQRGQPDTSKSVTDGGPRVFETYKSAWEVFHTDGSAPADWNSYDKAQFNACNATASFGDVILASFSKFSDLGQAGNGSLVGPLVAQNQTYTRYLIGFNKVGFDQISSDTLYRRPTPPAKFNVTFSNSALDVKSAWILMDNIPHPERYYKKTALVLDPKSGTCSPATVGLVGLHIVQKTPTRPQWIWSTFEQVDNVPPSDPAGPGPFNFNNGKGDPMPEGNPYPINPLILPTPAPFNVTRLIPINASTVNTNNAYRNLLKAARGDGEAGADGSVWQYYQLVMTQWPISPSRPDLPGTPANTFPGAADHSSAFTNMTMETFDQVQNGQPFIQGGCMNCHNFTRVQTDFLWSLNDHAFPPGVPDFLFRDTAFRDLQALLTSMAPPSKLTPNFATQPVAK